VGDKVQYSVPLAGVMVRLPNPDFFELIPQGEPLLYSDVTSAKIHEACVLARWVGRSFNFFNN
jgi:hypothetical protein